MYRRYCVKKNQKSCYFIQNYLPVITSMYLFYSVSNIDISKYRIYFIVVVLSLLLLMSHLQSIFITIKIEATKKRLSNLISANWGQYTFLGRKILSAEKSQSFIYLILTRLFIQLYRYYICVCVRFVLIYFRNICPGDTKASLRAAGTGVRE